MTLSVRALANSHAMTVMDGIRQEVLWWNSTSLRHWLLSDHPGSADFPWADGWMRPLLMNGLPGVKLTIAVVGDGFTREEQGAYNNAVDTLLMNGVLANDFFADNRKAFNVLRINLVSNVSGCGTVTYNASGAETARADRDTALGLYYSGNWNKSWLEEGPNSRQRLNAALRQWAPEHHLVIGLLNNPGNGGRGGDGRAFLARGVTWRTLAHEIGHAFGRLGDEYCKPAASTGASAYGGGNPTEPVEPNLTINTDPTTLKWRSFVAAGTPIPTGTGACATFAPGAKPAGWNDNESVGLFEGGRGFNTMIYRPALSCRMNDESVPFCPVCRAVMDAKIRPKLDDVYDGFAMPPPGSDKARRVAGGYVRLVVRSEGGTLRITEAQDFAGDLVGPDMVAEGLAHEVLIGDRRVAVGALDDVGLVRSFSEPGPDGPVPHRLQSEDIFDFVVRVPKATLRGAEPASLAVHLLDVPSGNRVALADSIDQASALRVASLPQLQAAVLPNALRRAIAVVD